MFGIFSKSKKKKASSKKKKKNGQKNNPAEAAKSSEFGEAELMAEAVSLAKEEELAPAPHSHESIASAQEALDQAKANLDAGNFKKKLAPSEREALIQQALAVHKVQSKLIDDLGEETKQRLRTFAMEKVFKITPKN